MNLITLNIASDKFAFIQTNRSVKIAKEFKNSIKEKGILVPIMGVCAEELLEEYELYDASTSEKLDNQSRKDYYVITDGQHCIFRSIPTHFLC